MQIYFDCVYVSPAVFFVFFSLSLSLTVSVPRLFFYLEISQACSGHGSLRMYFLSLLFRMSFIVHVYHFQMIESTFVPQINLEQEREKRRISFLFPTLNKSID